MIDCAYCGNQRRLTNAYGEDVQCPVCSPQIIAPVRATEAMRAAIKAVQDAQGEQGKWREK